MDQNLRGIAYCLPMFLVDYHMLLYNLDQVDCLSVAIQRPPKTRPFCQHFRFMNLTSFSEIRVFLLKKDLIGFWDIFRFQREISLEFLLIINLSIYRIFWYFNKIIHDFILNRFLDI